MFRQAPSSELALSLTLPFWPLVLIGLAGAMSGWLCQQRSGGWHPIFGQPTRPAATPRRLALPPAPAPVRDSPAALVPVVQAEGADLAERARFVAMNFAFPEPGWSRQTPTDWPLQIGCLPLRFILMPGLAVLRYRLELWNRGAETLGPLIIRADLVAESRTAECQTELAAPELTTDVLPLCHYLDRLTAGDGVELSGELRLALADVATLRLGSAELLVPMMRLCAESAGDAPEGLNISADFAIGQPPLSAGGGIRPFRLDSGPGIWRKLTARRRVVAH
jgi:hypothetical protein